MKKNDMSQKIISKEDVLKCINKKNQIVVFTNGCFDILHIGHLRFLKWAKSLGDISIVAVNSDESTRQLKGDSRPIFHLAERMELISGLECVDYIIEQNEINGANLINFIKPHIYAKGGEYTKEALGDFPEGIAILACGGEIKTISSEETYSNGYSTSKIINHIKDYNV
jgi:D-beta-D-heptose 7-phosphate kinase/D-beta-D-heptose 1-phosphate adenosyltransferase